VVVEVVGATVVAVVVDVLDVDVEATELQLTTPDVPLLPAQRIDPALHPTERDWPAPKVIFDDEPEASAAATIAPQASTDRMTKTIGLRFGSMRFGLLGGTSNRIRPAVIPTLGGSDATNGSRSYRRQFSDLYPPLIILILLLAPN
jgi:hypothetical protein